MSTSLRLSLWTTGLLGTLLRYPYEVRDEKEYFDEIQDVKVTKDMLDLAKHIVTQKTGEFEPEKFEGHYEAALAELINAKRNGKTVGPKPRPKGENVVDLMDALKKSLATEATTTKGKKPRKASSGQKEMLLPIEGKRGAEKKAAKPVRTSAAERLASSFSSRTRLLELTLPFPLKGELWRLAKRSKIGAKSNRFEKFASNINSVP